MPGAGDFTDPVGYAAAWTLVAVVLPLLVVGWYAGVTWWTRDRTVSRQPDWWRLRVARRRHLRDLDRIEAARAAGTMSTREAHQAVSATLRSFVAAVGPLDARTMNLHQLRAAAPSEVVQVVEAVYPPAFGPGSGAAPPEDFVATLSGARDVMTGWQR